MNLLLVQKFFFQIFDDITRQVWFPTFILNIERYELLKLKYIGLSCFLNVKKRN